MKKLFLMLCVTSTLFITSCGDDDGPSANGGQVSFDGQDYPLTTAYRQDYGENDNGSFDVDIALTSKTVDLNDENFSDLTFIYLDLNTSQKNVLEAGTYTFGEDRDKFVMVDGSVALNVTSDSNGEISQGTFFDATGGTVNVTVSGETYTITFTLTGDNDQSASGSYTGTLTQLATD